MRFHVTLKQDHLFGQTCWTVGESEPGLLTVWGNIHHNCQPCSGSWSREIWLGSQASVPPGHTSLQQGETAPHWWEIRLTLFKWDVSKTDRKVRECDFNMTTNYSRDIQCQVALKQPTTLHHHATHHQLVHRTCLIFEMKVPNLFAPVQTIFPELKMRAVVLGSRIRIITAAKR